MVKRVKKISKKWIEHNREFFREFLNETNFPDPIEWEKEDQSSSTLNG